jgi:hypothetical protein
MVAACHYVKSNTRVVAQKLFYETLVIKLLLRVAQKTLDWEVASTMHEEGSVPPVTLSSFSPLPTIIADDACGDEDGVY